MAAINRVPWLINAALLLTLNFSRADGSNNGNDGVQRLISTTQPTTEDLSRRFGADPDYDRRSVRFNDVIYPEPLSFQKLPNSYKSAFLNVETLITNTDQIVSSAPNMSISLVYNRETQAVTDERLEKQVSEFRFQSTLVRDVWKAVTHVNGCCGFFRVHRVNDTLTNIYGRQRKLVHFRRNNPPMFQFAQHAICDGDSYGPHGHCILGYVVMSFFVIDLSLNPPIDIDFFNIPAYCHCVHY